ncbi:MAG: DUF3341 domain-containing protein [Fimbriimonadaceae bacterium]
MRRKSTLYGLVAQFDDAEDLVVAAQKTLDAGYSGKHLDAFTPFPVHGLPEAIGFEESKVPWIIFLSGCAGAAAGVGLQYYVSVMAYQLNVGGRPFFSWPLFIPVTFETTVLFAAFGATFGMLALNGLPKPYDPIFNTPNFERASQDKFFLAIESGDPNFDLGKTKAFMDTLGAEAVSEVER